MIRYIPSNRSPILFMNEERLPRADLYIAPETYKRRQELMRERFEQMIAYAANEQECRSAVLELAHQIIRLCNHSSHKIW